MPGVDPLASICCTIRAQSIIKGNPNTRLPFSRKRGYGTWARGLGIKYCAVHHLHSGSRFWWSRGNSRYRALSIECGATIPVFHWGLFG